MVYSPWYMHFRETCIPRAVMLHILLPQQDVKVNHVLSFCSYNIVTQKMAKMLYTKKCQELLVIFNLPLEIVHHCLALV